jgi:hypothetical protein
MIKLNAVYGREENQKFNNNQNIYPTNEADIALRIRRKEESEIKVICASNINIVSVKTLQMEIMLTKNREQRNIEEKSKFFCF